MAATVKATKTAAKRPAAKPAAAKRAAPRTRKALPPVAPLPEADFEMIRLVSSPEAERPRVPLFSIDDTVYSIEAKPGMNIALEALHLFRTGGELAAIDFLLNRLLGDAGYRALREYDELTPAQFMQIGEIAMRITLGGLELPKD
jgi:hypothetical protein